MDSYLLFFFAKRQQEFYRIFIRRKNLKYNCTQTDYASQHTPTAKTANYQ